MGHLVFLLRVLHGSDESLSGQDQVDETHPCFSPLGVLGFFLGPRAGILFLYASLCETSVLVIFLHLNHLLFSVN